MRKMHLRYHYSACQVSVLPVKREWVVKRSIAATESDLSVVVVGYVDSLDPDMARNRLPAERSLWTGRTL